MLDVDIAPDGDMIGAQCGPLAEEDVGLGLDHALVGDLDARVDIDADEGSSRSNGDGQRGGPVIAKDIDAHGQVDSIANGANAGGHGGDGDMGHASGEEGDITEVFDNDGVESGVGEGARIGGGPEGDFVDG
jgi:hypothetical protein